MARNFGRRGATESGRSEEIQATVTKTQVSAKSQDDVWLTPASAGRLKVGRRKSAKLATSPVNGGRNYNGPKVAKFCRVSSDPQ